MSLITTRPHEVADATLKYLSSLSIVLTDWEIRFSCIKNESDFWPAICQLHLLSKLQRIKIQFEFIASSYLYKKEDRLVAQETCLFKEQMETMNQLWHICNRRMTGIDEAMAECGFGNSIPCRKLFKQLPPYYSQVPADIHLQEVAQGRSVYEWADHKRHQYEKDPAFQNKSRGVLERQIWDDLPPELKEWVPKPKEEPLGFQLSWHDTMSNTEFQEKLLSCLQTLRRDARADMANCACKMSKPNTHSMTRKPRGILRRRSLKKLQPGAEVIMRWFRTYFTISR